MNLITNNHIKKLSRNELNKKHEMYMKYDMYQYGNKMCKNCGDLLNPLQKCDCDNIDNKDG